MAYTFDEMSNFLKKSKRSRIDGLEQLCRGKAWTVSSMSGRENSRDDLAKVVHSFADELHKAYMWIERIHGDHFTVIKDLVEAKKENEDRVVKEVDSLRTDVVTKLEEIKETIKHPNSPGEESGKMNYARAVGDSASLVLPMKKAIKQIKREEEKSCNLIVHGLDIDPKEMEDQARNLKIQAANAVDAVINDEFVYPKERRPDIAEMVVLGKIGTSGKAPPILVKLKTADDQETILKYAKNLKDHKILNRVYLTRDFSKEYREQRKQWQQKLKEKIRESPESHWEIRNGQIVTTGPHKSMSISRENGNPAAETSFSYEY